MARCRSRSWFLPSDCCVEQLTKKDQPDLRAGLFCQRLNWCVRGEGRLRQHYFNCPAGRLLQPLQPDYVEARRQRRQRQSLVAPQVSLKAQGTP